MKQNMKTAPLWLAFLPNKGRTKFTSGAHDVIAITSPRKNPLTTEGFHPQARAHKNGRLEQLWPPVLMRSCHKLYTNLY